jgi:beta-galactosidase
VLGGQLRDFRLLGRICSLELQTPAFTLPSHLWINQLRPDAAKTIGAQNGWITATHHHYGKGQSYWIPSPIGLGARVSENYAPLANLLRWLLVENLDDLPVRFSEYASRVYQRILKIPDGFITVHANTGDQPTAVALEIKSGLKSEVLWRSPEARLDNSNKLQLPVRGTLVCRWRKQL